MVENNHDAELTWASERHLRLCFAGPDSQQTYLRVHQSLVAIERARLPGLLGITPAYATILLEFDIDRLDETRTVNAVRRALADAIHIPERAQSPIVEIPVCYESVCAPDGEEVARVHGIDPHEIVRLHSQPEYVVRFIGFVPGFAYLSGLPSRLVTPRLATPRLRVPAGSVGIAGEQTGVYPRETAGGWRLIGRTPLVMFDAGREKPSLLTTGDRVRFVPISLTEFNEHKRGQPHHE